MYYDIAESGKRIRELRKQKGLTQETLAEDLNISVESISKIERGKTGSSVEMIANIAEYFETTIDYLIRGKSNNNSVADLLAGLSVDKRRIAIKMLKVLAED